MENIHKEIIYYTTSCLIVFYSIIFIILQEAVRLLLSRRHILRADDPNADYHYAGKLKLET